MGMIFDTFEEKSFASFIGDIAWDAWNIEIESSTSLLRMMFDMLDLLGDFSWYA